MRVDSERWQTIAVPWLPLRARWLAQLERWAQKLHRGRERHGPHQLGRRGEELAYWFLRGQGFTIVARNYRSPGRRGEIDLIGRQGEVLVFIEVKSRNHRDVFPAERRVDFEKRKQLVRLARAYRRRRAFTGPFRFDVVAVYRPEDPNPEIELFRDAFWAR